MSHPDTWMPLYVGDYLADTGRLTTEMHGAYLLMIMEYWKSREPLPDCDQQLASITRLRIERWVEMRPILARYFVIGDGLWHHNRIDREMANAKAKYDIRLERSRKANEAKEAKKGTNKVTYKATNKDSSAVSNKDTQSQSQSTNVDISVADATETMSKPTKPASDAFAIWYQRYPNKVGKAAAQKAFATAIRKASLETLLEALERYCERLRRPNAPHACNPATWLNQERWLDDPMERVTHEHRNDPRPAKPHRGPSAWRDALERAEAGAKAAAADEPDDLRHGGFALDGTFERLA